MAEHWNDRGAAAVEMAFVAMLLILLATGVADLGRVLFTYVGVQDAAQEGAMYASYHPEDPVGAMQRATASIDYPTLSPVDVGVSCSTADNTVTVTVTHAVDLLTPVIGNMVGGEIVLTRSFTGEMLGGACP